MFQGNVIGVGAEPKEARRGTKPEARDILQRAISLKLHMRAASRHVADHHGHEGVFEP
jgi:hypothetical protein